MIPHNRVVLQGEDAVMLASVLDSGQIGPGPQVRALEAELAERFRPGAEAACVCSGTAALRLAVIAMGLTDMTLPTYACTSLYHAVNDGVGDLGLMDCDPETLASAAASVVVHTYGVPVAVPAGAIEDFTHAAGGEIDGRPCGSFGAASVLSFGATKPLGVGGGGAVLGPPDLIAEIRDLRDYDGKRDFRPRFNWQFCDLLAALARHRLERLDAEVEARRSIAARYETVCHDRGLKFHGGTQSTRYRFVVHVPDPPSAIVHFAKAGVEVINPLEPWELLHRQVSLEPADFPAAEGVAASTISLPVWPGMQASQVERVADALGHLRVVTS